MKLKKNKHVEDLGTLDDFLAPWETASGENEIDKARLKKYIYGLLKDKATAQDARVESEGAVAEAAAKVTEVEDKLAAADSTGEVARLQKELATATASGETASLDLLRIKVGDEAGLTIKQSLRLQGKDEAELKTDAEDILETFGVKKGSEETDEEKEEREEREEEERETAEEAAAANPLRRAPLRNSGDSRPREGSSAEVIDIAKAVDGFRRNIL